MLLGVCNLLIAAPKQLVLADTETVGTARRLLLHVMMSRGRLSC